MREITLSERKEIGLQILIKFDHICRDNDIQYWLAYGTLLGCIRHHGFIPWDDDIDVIIPRSDYEKLCNLDVWEEDTNLIFVQPGKTKEYYRLYARIDDPRTKIIHRQMIDYPNAGVGIDIFPLDGLGNDYKKAARRVKKIELLKMIVSGSLYKDPSDVFRNEKNIIKRFVKFFIAHSKWKNDLFCRYAVHLAKKNEFKDSEFIGGVNGGVKGIKKKELFNETIEASFEGYRFLILKEYDLFLKQTYGDYMKLPPADQRCGHTFEDAFWKD